MKIHYKNLNSLRFFAAIAVLYGHVGQIEAMNHLPIGRVINHNLGKIAVDLFFALSGFLITSLLIAEKDKFEKISIKEFYVRRILRIWPLYFIIVILSLYILPNIDALRIAKWVDPREHLVLNSFLAFFFLPNIQIYVVGLIPYMQQTWSIGVEEQYYLFWPLVVNKIKSTKLLKRVIVICVVAFVLVKASLIVILHFNEQWTAMQNSFDILKNCFQYDCLLIGGFFAIINLSDRKKIFTGKLQQVCIYLLLIVVFVSAKDFNSFYWEIYAAIFGLIILNVVNESSIVNFDNRILNYLGKISYGIYMYHFLIVSIVIKFISNNYIIIYLLSIGLTILISSLSYEFIESRFLEIKRKKFTKIVSG